MSFLGYAWLVVAVVFIASTGLVVWLADRAPVGEPDRSQLDEWDEHPDREAFERLLHPSGGGLCDLDARWPS